MKENRKHTRIAIALNAEILLPNGKKCIGKTKNISFGGIFIDIEGHNILEVGGEYDIILLLEGSQQRIEIKIHAMIVHKLHTGIGFQFTGIEIDHYEHFKNLMVHNCPDPSVLLDEVQKNPGIKLG